MWLGAYCYHNQSIIDTSSNERASGEGKTAFRPFLLVLGSFR